MEDSVEEKVSFLPVEDLEYLENKDYVFEQIEELDKAGRKKMGLIIREYPLPKGKYQVDAVDILVIIPMGYNDVNPDMFFCHPHLKLTSTGSEPQNTNGRVQFDGINWQQWSRHSNTGNDWRKGIDGIKSHLRKVDNALLNG